MKKGTQGWVIAAGVVVGVFGLWMLWAQPAVDTAQRKSISHAEVELPDAVNLDFPDAPGDSANDLPPAPSEQGEELPDGALAGHRVWHAEDAAALAALEAQARATGLTVHSTIPALGMIHVSGDEAVLRSMRPDAATEEFVYRVALPRHPEPTDLSTEGLTEFGERALEFLGLAEVPAGWGNGVSVAVLDTGIAAHAALADARIASIADGTDTNGHGTAMTGLLVGRDDYARGLAPGANILNLPVLDADGQATTFDVARAIVEAVDRGANVINLSAGSSYNTNSLERAAAYAHERGVVIVAAAGNEGIESVRYPAGYDSVIGVTTVDRSNRIPAFANTGSAVDVAAPGVGVYSAWRDEGYVSISGSSAAAPFVSGAIAMLMSETPGLSAQEAAAIVLEYTNEAGPPGRDDQFGAGVLSLDRLVNRDASGVTDLAVVTPYLALNEATEMEAPIYLSLQNRGTESLNQTRLDLEVNGITYTYTVGTLGVGESGGVRLPVPLEDLRADEGLIVKMKGWYRGDAEDARPGNDAIEVVLRIGSNDEAEETGE